MDNDSLAILATLYFHMWEKKHTCRKLKRVRELKKKLGKMGVKDVELGREAKKKIGRGVNISEVKRDKIYMYVYICVYFHILRSQQLG